MVEKVKVSDEQWEDITDHFKMSLKNAGLNEGDVIAFSGPNATDPSRGNAIVATQKEGKQIMKSLTESMSAIEMMEKKIGEFEKYSYL